MNNSTDTFQTLVELGATPTSGVYLAPGCDDAVITQMQIAAVRDLGEEVPAPFVRLLQLTNGAQINSAYFKEAENLVLESLDMPRPEIIVLGQEGNVTEYVFDRRDRQFHIINIGFPEERLASYATFEELLRAVLEEQQVI